MREWSKNLLHLNVAACLLKMGELRKSIEICNKILKHYKPTCFQMMSVDKSSAYTTKAWLASLTQYLCEADFDAVAFCLHKDDQIVVFYFYLLEISIQIIFRGSTRSSH